MKQCQRCLLPVGSFGVKKLDTKGVCKYCNYFEKWSFCYADYNKHHQVFKEKITRIRGDGDYDVMAGLSGGKDSTYVLYQLVHKYKLKVLAVTYNNGFLSEYARQNISKIVKHLGVDHFFYEPDWEALKCFYRVATFKLGWPCYACFVSGYFLAIKVCMERRIPFFVHGRSPFQMFRNFYQNSNDPTRPLIDINLEKHSFVKLAKYYRKLSWQMKVWLYFLVRNKRERILLSNEFFSHPQITKEFAPELIGYFLFELYDEEKIKKFLESKEVGYERPANDKVLGHGDCRIHDAAWLLFKEKHQACMEQVELAVMLRHGAVNQEQAKRIMNDIEPSPDNLTNSIDYFCSRIGIARAKYDQYVEQLRRKGSRGFWGH